MNRNVTLTVMSLLSIVLFITHVSDDVVRGIDRVSAWNLIGVGIFVLWLYGTLVLYDRRSGYIIMLLGGLFGELAGMSHMILGVSRTLEKMPDGALFFVFNIWAVAITSTFSIVLAIRGLRRREWMSFSRNSAPA